MKEVIRFSVVLMRVAGIIVFAPVLSNRTIPVSSKLVIALVSTMALVPSVSMAQIPDDLGLVTILMCALSQIVFGMILGLAASFVFAALQLAGQIISLQLGFTMIHLIDPSSEVEMPVFSFLQENLGLILFMLLGGHHWFFLAISNSFSFLPILGLTLKGGIVQEVIRLSAQVLVTGVQIAGPIIAVSITVDVIMGITGRAAPQIHIMIVGMPLKTLVGFACLSLSFYFLPQFLAKSFTQIYHDLFALMRAMA